MAKAKKVNVEKSNIEETVVKLDTYEVEFKKSSVIADSEYDFIQLTKENANFVGLEISKNEDAFQYLFQIENLIKLSGLKGLNIVDKYRLLINATNLYETSKFFDFNLNPDNLYIDYNLNVRVAIRDVYSKEALINEDVFVKKCLCLIGAVLQDKFDYETLNKSGVDLLNKHKNTAVFAGLTTVAEIKKQLLEVYASEKDFREAKLQVVNKKKYKRGAILSKAYIAVIVLLCGLLGFYYFYQKPYTDALNDAYKSYVASDYVNVIKTMDSVSISRMDQSEKYMLTMSYVKSDALTDAQKKNILSGITLATDEKVLDFWVHLAKNDEEQAIDIAKQLRNDEYMLYGYMKQKSSIEGDDSLTGAERESQLKEVNSKITEYKKSVPGNEE